MHAHKDKVAVLWFHAIGVWRSKLLSGENQHYPPFFFVAVSAPKLLPQLTPIMNLGMTQPVLLGIWSGLFSMQSQVCQE